jgi:type III secretory pathway component EscS
MKSIKETLKNMQEELKNTKLTCTASNFLDACIASTVIVLAGLGASVIIGNTITDLQETGIAMLVGLCIAFMCFVSVCRKVE